MIKCKTIDGRAVELHEIDYREQLALGHIAEGPKIEVTEPPEKAKTEHSIRTLKPEKEVAKEKPKEAVDPAKMKEEKAERVNKVDPAEMKEEKAESTESKKGTTIRRSGVSARKKKSE